MDFNKDLPAQDLEAEKSLIGSLVTQNSLFDRIRVLPHDFYSKRHGNAFKTILNMLARKDPVDVVTFYHQTKKDFPSCGSITEQELFDILDNSPLMEVEKYQDIILECSITRQIKTACSAIIHSDRLGNDILADAQKAVLAVTAADHEDDIKKISDIIQAHMDRIDTANTTEATNFLRFGFPNIDKRLRAIGPKLIVIAGRPGAGKTSFALSSIKNLDRAGHNVGFLSIEMPEFEIIDRLLSIH